MRTRAELTDLAERLSRALGRDDLHVERLAPGDGRARYRIVDGDSQPILGLPDDASAAGTAGFLADVADMDAAGTSFTLIADYVDAYGRALDDGAASPRDKARAALVRGAIAQASDEELAEMVDTIRRALLDEWSSCDSEHAALVAAAEYLAPGVV
jgi:hypothetical protein